MYPRLIKSYAVIEDFDPKSTNDLTLNLKHAAFGLHFKITPPEEGTLEINYLGWKLAQKSGQTGYDGGSIYAFSEIVEATKDGYQLVAPLEMKWTKANGTVVQEHKDLTLKRNVKTKVEIVVEGPKARNISFREENVAMTEEQIEWHVVK